MSAPVLILGAGFAGLSAADALSRRGIRAHLIEARDRIGGRTWTQPIAEDLEVDLGGQWLGPGQDRLYALAARLGHAVWPMHVSGRDVLHLRGRARTFRGLLPYRIPPLALANLLWAFGRLEWRARQIPLGAPWTAPGAARLDQQTVGDWMRRNIHHRDTRLLITIAIESVFAAHPDDVGLLYALSTFRAGGGLSRLTASQGGAQQDRVTGGMQGLAEAWLRELQTRGVALSLEAPVRAVEQGEGEVRVHTDREVFRGARVICTLPPALTSEVEFRPEMPQERLEWCRALRPGQVIKCFAVYSSPFWRAQGLSGSAVGELPPVHVSFDATPPGTDKGVLMAFIEGREATRWAERTEERREAVIQAFTRFFGAQAASPIQYVDQDWTSEPWSRGCYAGIAGPGLITASGAAPRLPHRRVHWAGTETATEWIGYIEGAIRSGIRAAEEIPHV